MADTEAVTSPVADETAVPDAAAPSTTPDSATAKRTTAADSGDEPSAKRATKEEDGTVRCPRKHTQRKRERERVRLLEGKEVRRGNEECRAETGDEKKDAGFVVHPKPVGGWCYSRDCSSLDRAASTTLWIAKSECVWCYWLGRVWPASSVGAWSATAGKARLVATEE